MAVRTALEWCNSCSGCEIAILNIGEDLVGLLTEHLQLVHAPVLMDHKTLGQLGESDELTLPEAELGMVSGGISNTEHLEVVLQMRRQCKTLVALGTCATHGGIPALMNGYGLRQGLEEVFTTRPTDADSRFPDTQVPEPLERVYALDEKVAIDIHLPGCPPNPGLIAEVLTAVTEDRQPVLPGKSVCDTCPVKREGKGAVSQVRRFLVNAEGEEGPLENMRCLLEQGFMCMGPVTAAGCAGKSQPRCIAARVPCRGCFGPVRKGGNQMLDMMNALASNGIDFKSVLDRRSLLRFSGAHGRLRPLKKK